MVTILFAGDIGVQYGFIFLHPEGDDVPPDSGIRGQVNGLCGVPGPGELSLTTGLHTGDVPFVVEVLDEAPQLEAEWEEIVEVSLVADTTAYELAAFDTVLPLTLPAPGSYRVRYNAVGMDLARKVDVRRRDEEVLDNYRLQLWREPARPDAILRQTSQVARYWHGVAQGTDSS